MDNSVLITDPIGSLVPRRKLAEELGVSTRTIFTHEKDDPAFPKAVFVNKRRYYSRRAIDAWKAGLVSRSMHREPGDSSVRKLLVEGQR